MRTLFNPRVHAIPKTERLVLVCGFVLAAATAHCRDSAEPAPQAAAPTPPPTAAPLPSRAAPSDPSHAALPLEWTDPTRWVRRPASSPMRAAEYTVPRAAGDSSDGECTVITFGSGQGGGVEENVGRWVRQFDPLSGAPIKSTVQAGGMTVTRVEVAGSYHPMRMPGAPSGPSTEPGARLVGAIVEAPSGLWFFKLTGPDATVKAAAPELDGMVASLHGA